MGISSTRKPASAGIAVLATLAFLSAPASVGSARPVAHAQRIAIEERIRLGAGSGTFTLIPLTPGPLKADSGTYTYTAKELPAVMRGGQRVARYTGIDTLTGKRGTLRIPNTTASTEAGGGYSAGTGTWSLGRGSGAYAAVTAAGRASAVGTPSGLVTSRYEGYVRAR